MFKKKEKSSQEFYPYYEILDNGLIRTDGGYLKILKITPINYDLKSKLEKEAILNSYKLFLKTCNFNFQILIQSKKENLSNYITNIKNNIEENENLQKLSNDYLSYIQKLETNNKSSTKEFFIVLKYTILENQNFSEEFAQNSLSDDYYKIKETLSRCGNTIIVLASKLEVQEFLKDFYIK